MLRSVGIAAVIVGLAWPGLAGAQSSSPLEKARYINVSEEGKPSQRCKIIKTWREANGAAAFQVQAVDSGELMTIVGTAPCGAGGDSREMTTRIFRWGRENKPPTGAPVPPPTVAAPATPPSVTVQKNSGVHSATDPFWTRRRRGTPPRLGSTDGAKAECWPGYHANVSDRHTHDFDEQQFGIADCQL